MAIPGFSAENALYRSTRSYATRSTAYGASHESVAFARINDRRSDTAGYDPEKGWPVDPWGTFGVTPHEESPDAFYPFGWLFLKVAVMFLFGSFVAEGTGDCQDGKVLTQDVWGKWVCDDPHYGAG